MYTFMFDKSYHETHYQVIELPIIRSP